MHTHVYFWLYAVRELVGLLRKRNDTTRPGRDPDLLALLCETPLHLSAYTENNNNNAMNTFASRVKEGKIGVLRRFQQPRSYSDEIETRNREEIHFSSSNSSKESFSCRRTIDSHPQWCTFIQ